MVVASLGRCLFLKKKKFSIFDEHFSSLFLLPLDPLGRKISKGYSSHKFATVPEFSFPMVLTTITLRIFEILKLEILTNLFANMGPNVSDNFKRLLLLQIANKRF